MATHSTDEARSKDPERVQEKCLPAAHAGSPVGGYKNFFRCTYGCLVVLLFVMIGSLVFKQIRWDRVLVLVPRRWGAVCLGCVFSMAPLVCAAPWWVGLILLWAWILWALWVRRPPGVPRDSATQCSLWFSWAAAPITEGSSLKWGLVSRWEGGACFDGTFVAMWHSLREWFPGVGLHGPNSRMRRVPWVAIAGSVRVPAQADSFWWWCTCRCTFSTFWFCRWKWRQCRCISRSKASRGSFMRAVSDACGSSSGGGAVGILPRSGDGGGVAAGSALALGMCDVLLGEMLVLRCSLGPAWFGLCSGSRGCGWGRRRFGWRRIRGRWRFGHMACVLLVEMLMMSCFRGWWRFSLGSWRRRCGWGRRRFGRCSACFW